MAPVNAGTAMHITAAISGAVHPSRLNQATATLPAETSIAGILPMPRLPVTTTVPLNNRTLEAFVAMRENNDVTPTRPWRPATAGPSELGRHFVEEQTTKFMYAS
jgi:hypothetical protein